MGGEMMSTYYKNTARFEWEKARRKVFWARLTNDSRPLLSFNEVARFFQLRTPVYRDRKSVV